MMTTNNHDSIFINNFFDRFAGCILLKHEGDVQHICLYDINIYAKCFFTPRLSKTPQFSFLQCG